MPDGKRRGRPARARPRRRGSPDPIPNSAAKPAIAQSTADPVRGRTGRRARAGRVRPHRGQGARRGGAAGPLPRFQGAFRPPFLFYVESQPAQAFCMLEDWISRLLTLLASGHYFLFTDCLTIYSRRLALCRTFFCIGRYWFANSQDEQALLLFTTFPRDEFELSMHSSPLLGMNPYFSETLHQSGVQ